MNAFTDSVVNNLRKSVIGNRYKSEAGIIWTIVKVINDDDVVRFGVTRPQEPDVVYYFAWETIRLMKPYR